MNRIRLKWLEKKKSTQKLKESCTKNKTYPKILDRSVNTPLTPMDRSTKPKINKETQTLNDTID